MDTPTDSMQGQAPSEDAKTPAQPAFSLDELKKGMLPSELAKAKNDAAFADSMVKRHSDFAARSQAKEDPLKSYKPDAFELYKWQRRMSTGEGPGVLEMAGEAFKGVSKGVRAVAEQAGEMAGRVSMGEFKEAGQQAADLGLVSGAKALSFNNRLVRDVGVWGDKLMTRALQLAASSSSEKEDLEDLYLRHQFEADRNSAADDETASNLHKNAVTAVQALAPALDNPSMSKAVGAVFGHTDVNEDAANLLSMLPQMATEGAIALSATRAGLTGAASRAALASKSYEAASDALRSARSELSKAQTARTAAVKNFGKAGSAEVIRDTTKWVETLTEDIAQREAKLAELAKKAEEAAVIASEEATKLGDKLGNASTSRKVAGTTAEYVGDKVSSLGNKLEALQNLPDNVGRALAPESPKIQGAIGSTIRSGVAGAAGYAAGELLGGDSGGQVGGAVGLAMGLGGGRLVSGVMRVGGKDLSRLGEIYAAGEATLPFFRNVRMARDVSGFTKQGAAWLDRSVFAESVGLSRMVGGTVKGAAAAGTFGAGLGALTNPGDPLAGAAEGFGSGAAFGATVGFFGQWRSYDNAGQIRKERAGQARVYRDNLEARPDEAKIFDQLPQDVKEHIANYTAARPDLKVRYVDDVAKANGSYEGKTRPNEIEINVKSKDPLRDVVAHEIGHYIANHELGDFVNRTLLGDVQAGIPGEYVARDEKGQPIMETGPDGKPQYQLNADFEAKRKSYVDALKNTAKRNNWSYEETKLRVEEVSDPKYIAGEIFAETVIDHLNSDKHRRDLKGLNFDGRVRIESPPDVVVNSSFLRETLGALGFVFGKEGDIKSSILGDVRRSATIEGALREYNRRQAMAKSGEVEFVGGNTTIDEKALTKATGYAERYFNATGEILRDSAGNPIYDKEGRVTLRSKREVEREAREVGKAVREILDRDGPVPDDPHVLQKRTTVDGATVYSGRYLSEGHIAAIEASGKFNPIQIETIKRINEELKSGLGIEWNHFYQAALSKETGNRYRSLSGRWRTDLVYGFQISAQDNILLRSISLEVLNENAAKSVKRGEAKSWNNDLGDLLKDTRTYLENLANEVPGETGIGVEKKNFINNLLGIRVKAHGDVNPWHDITNQPKTVLTALRIDRMNQTNRVSERNVPLSAESVQRASKNQRPDSPQLRPDVLPIPERFTGTGEEEGRQSRKVDAPGFFKKFDIDEYTKGGKYFDLASGEDVTGRTYESGSIDVNTGKPALKASDTQVEAPKEGRKIKTNLFKQSAGWKWVGEAPAKTSTLVSVETGGDHFYTLNSQFNTPLEMARYEGQKSEPRLRPTTRGVVQLGEKVGEIEVRGRTHPVYDRITTSSDAPGRGIVARGEDSIQFRPDANPETAKVAEEYMKERGIPYVPHNDYDALPEEKLKRIADHFQNVAKHEPENPDVQRSYQALADETLAQYRAMERAGITVEPFTGKGEPYKNSTEMMKDVRENKHLSFFLTDNGFGSGGKSESNPLLQKSGVVVNGHELLMNDLFRVVHDYFGHTQQGLEFGPRGEFNAWKSHSRMFSPEAQGALAAETLAQNAWVNFGPHLRDANGNVAKKGEQGYILPQDRPFADQKNFVLPEELRQFRPDQTETPEFKRWFGDSKVVDETGAPRVVFHGTSANFNKFSRSKSAQGIFWFTSDKASIDAGEVGAQGNGRVMDLYASIKKPAGWDQYERMGLSELQREGYDGVILPGKDGEVTGFVFNPEQLKSASKNVGTFDPKNPDIRYRPDAMVGPVPEANDAAFAVSSRNPTAGKRTEDPMTSRLTIEGKHVIPDNAAMRDVAKILAKYPNFKKGTPAETIEQFKQQVKDNLLWLHDQMSPELRERAKQWYVGGRKVIESMSQEFNEPRTAVAGAIAALSPKNDWFVNIEQARRALSIRAELKKEGVTFAESDAAFLAGWSDNEKVQASARDAVGKSYDQLSPAQRALWVRSRDGQKGWQGATLYSPEGDAMGPVRNASGKATKVSYGMTPPLTKALAIIDNPTLENIHRLLGAEHKIRSFYNNLLLPNDPVGDVTIDTHAVGAALITPVASTDTPVSHNFGSGIPNSSVIGQSGLYGLYADAYRAAAKERGILPREMQSITWEAVRGLFPGELKKAGLKKAVAEIWQSYKNGTINIEDARTKIHDLAGGVRNPPWAVSDSR